MKQEYPPLFAPGLVEITMDDLERLFVEPFESPWARRRLVERLRDLIAVLQEIGLSCEVWIDGSFLTFKPEPSDIDMVILSDDESRAKLTVSQCSTLDKLIKNKDRTRYRYKCDLSFCGRHDLKQRDYWFRLYGYSRSKQPKGIARLSLAVS
jgi:hypothetical protein